MLRDLVTLIGEAFNCMEATILFRAPVGEAPGFDIMASTWPIRIKKAHYAASVDDGATGWILAKGKSVRVFDLDSATDLDSDVVREYPGLVWKDSLQVGPHLRRLWNWPKEGRLPPLGWMGVPILAGDEVIGAVRCCTVRAEEGAGPYSFGESELRLLELVAARLGKAWALIERRYDMSAENRTWHRLITGISELNTVVSGALRDRPLSERNVLLRALGVSASVFPDADSLDIRWVESDSLEIREVHGKAWKERGRKTVRRLKGRFPLAGHSWGAVALRRSRVVILEDARDAQRYGEAFRSTQGMIVAPVRHGDSKHGVLDIRFSRPGVFDRTAQLAADLLGRHIGLLHHLLSTAKRVDEVEAELVATTKAQMQTFEDLYHQLGGPLSTAQRRATLLVRLADENPLLISQLTAIRGLCGKAHRVAQSISLFVDLASGKAPRAAPSRIDLDSIVPILIEAAVDNEIMIDPATRIRINVDRKGFAGLVGRNISFDVGFLEQIVHNILDNAVKYSRSNTRIDVSGGTTRGGRFYISVRNTGIPLLPTEIAQAKTRRWRSETAEAKSGQGTGIGLWFVDEIMKVYGAELVLSPTDDRGVTEVRLVFPFSS